MSEHTIIYYFEVSILLVVGGDINYEHKTFRILEGGENVDSKVKIYVFYY